MPLKKMKLEKIKFKELEFKKVKLKKMEIRDYQKMYENSIKECKRQIDRTIVELAPKINKPLAVAGFFFTIAGLTIVAVIINAANIANRNLSAFPLAISFFCFIVSFVGYIIIHKSTERDLL